MVETAKEQAGVGIVRIHNHSAEISGSEISEEQRSFLQDVASYLPDMKFVVNPGTQPRALKYNYLKGGIKEEFFCDNGFERPKHGLFIQPCSWNPNYDSSLSLAPQKSLSAFLTFYFLLGQPITHRSESDGRTSNSEVSGGGIGGRKLWGFVVPEKKRGCGK